MNEIKQELQDMNFLDNKIEIVKTEITSKETQMASLLSEMEILREARQFLLTFTESIRDKMKDRIESIVNTALKAIYTDEPIEFKIIPKQTKNGVLYELFGVTSGQITPLKDCKGGGVLDIISMSLRISFLRLFATKLRQTMILDEPFKNLDERRIVLAVEWLKLVAHEFDMQFIINTHIVALKEQADNLIQFRKVEGVTTSV